MIIYNSNYTDEQKIEFFNKIEKSLQGKLQEIHEDLLFDLGIGYVPDDEMTFEVEKVKKELDNVFDEDAFWAFDKLIGDISDVPPYSTNPLKHPKAA